jgi:hypothetical protein
MNIRRVAHKAGYEIKDSGSRGPNRYRMLPIGWARKGGPRGPGYWAGTQRQLAELFEVFGWDDPDWSIPTSDDDVPDLEFGYGWQSDEM